MRCGSAADSTPAWLTAGALRRSTGIVGRGAIRTHGSAQFDPYRACLGVLRAAATSGAQVFERSTVRRIVADRDARPPVDRSGNRRMRASRGRDRICDRSIPTPRRSISDVPHLRAGDSSNQRARAPGGGPVRRHGVGHRAALSLCAMDARPSTDARWRRSPCSPRCAAPPTVRGRRRQACARTSKRDCRRCRTSKPSSLGRVSSQ